MYFVLQCFSPLFTRVARLDGLPKVEGVDSWMAGRMITAEVPQPLVIALVPAQTSEFTGGGDEDESDSALEGDEPDAEQPEDQPADEEQPDETPADSGTLLEMYQLGGIVMTKRLLKALRDSGVDNLQSFDVVLTDPVSGGTNDRYALVNVVGVVACADLGLSQYNARRGTPRIDTQFDSLVIDEDRAGHLDCFRLAECISAVIVHDRVRQSLLERGFTMLTFQDPRDFMS
jgi:hypothetical protein